MNVVIIDDNQINVTLLTHLIKKVEHCIPFGFTVSAEGLSWCEENEPDLIVIDYMMPAPDGMEFIERFRKIQEKKDIPILMITANHETSVRYQALELGATDFLTKPVDRVEFIARAKNMLALRKSQKALANRAEWLASEVRKATATILQRERETLWRLSKTAEYRDPETGAHILRMAHYSRHIAVNLGLSRQEQDWVFEAAPMHDIGKVGIPDDILLKPGKLTDEEFDIMKGHPLIGYEILKDSSSPVLQIAAEIAASHHEKFDGSGYPHGKKGEEIIIYGRIVAVADVFDALTSERPYKKAWEWSRAMELISSSAGTHFDPACVNAFFQNWQVVEDIYRRFSDEGDPKATKHMLYSSSLGYVPPSVDE